MGENQSRQQTDLAAILDKLRILDDLKKVADRQTSPELKIDFPEDDTCLSIMGADDRGQLLYGILTSPGGDQTHVVCEPIQDNIMNYGQAGPRHVLIYARISANTLVHPFYGIAQRRGRMWAVMKDLRTSKTLAQAIRDTQLPASVLDRVAIAHQIATTVEYLHSVEVLVKRLSDTKVLLCIENNSITPYLTDLEQARLVCLFSPQHRISCLTSSSSKSTRVGDAMISVMRHPSFGGYQTNNIASTWISGGMEWACSDTSTLHQP
jgi:serine/threonine protein kinase